MVSRYRQRGLPSWQSMYGYVGTSYEYEVTSTKYLRVTYRLKELLARCHEYCLVRRAMQPRGALTLLQVSARAVAEPVRRSNRAS